jgi:hypothetical protein
MDETLWGMMNIVGPIILLGLLLWLVLRSRSSGKPSANDPTEQATRDNYADEEQRRRDGTDGV